MADPSTSSGEALQGEAKRRYVAEMFSRIARRYDLMNTLMTAGMHHRWRKVAAKVATDGLEGTALDVGTGTGDLALALVREKGIDRVVGLDFLPLMVTRAESKARSNGFANSVRFTIGDALALPFPGDAFACVTSAWALRNVPELTASLREMLRVARPGGRVVSLESMPLEEGVMKPFASFFLHHMVPLMGQLIARDRAAYTYLPRSVDRFLTPDSLARQFENAGLRHVGYRRMGLGMVAVHWGTKA